MSCPNFEFMLYGMPMITSRTYSQMEKDFLDCYGEDNEDVGEFNTDMYIMMLQEAFDEAAALAASFSSDLKYHVVTVQDGYYDGFQFFVKELYADVFDLDGTSEYCIENDNAQYYFSQCKSKVLRDSAAEKRKIERWLNERMKDGYNRLVCRGVFSNGEASYAFA